jgi:hypothetical protein
MRFGMVVDGVTQPFTGQQYRDLKAEVKAKLESPSSEWTSAAALAVIAKF